MSNERPYRLALLGTPLGRGKLHAVNQKPPLPQRGRGTTRSVVEGALWTMNPT